MIFIPAIDLKNNKCVRLKQGKAEDITIFNEDPVQQAIFFEKNGCKRIHIVDLDGAFGKHDVNKNKILEIRKNTSIPIELGGGINNEEIVSFWINKGINYLVVGSLAITKKDFVFNFLKKFNNKIYIALDILKGKAMINGWTKDSGFTANEVLNFYENSCAKGYILTDIERDGMLNGLNTELIESFANKTHKRIIVGGGLANYDDLINLKNLILKNLEGVIAGKSFYSGNIKIKQALKIVNKDA